MLNAHAERSYLEATKRLYDAIPRSHFHVVGETANEEFTVLSGQIRDKAQADREAREEIEHFDRFERVHVKRCAGRWCGR